MSAFIVLHDHAPLVWSFVLRVIEVELKVTTNLDEMVVRWLAMELETEVEHSAFLASHDEFAHLLVQSIELIPDMWKLLMSKIPNIVRSNWNPVLGLKNAVSVMVSCDRP